MDFEESPLTNEEEEEKLKMMLQREDDQFIAFSVTGTRFMHYAAKYGKLNSLCLLIKYGYDVNVQTLLGTTPLMFAISEKKIDAMKVLLAAEADMFLRDYKNRHALHMILKMNKVEPALCLTFLQKLQKKCSSIEEMAQIMIDAGCCFYQVPFAKSVGLIRYFLKQGYPINEGHYVHKYTALHVAVALEDVNSVKVLLKNGANARALDSQGSSCLVYLYTFSNEHTTEKLAILKLLLRGLADFSTSCDLHGNFQIRSILETGSFEAVRVVLSSKINFTDEDSKKQSLLHCLAKNRNTGIANELKMHISKFDINQIDAVRQTPLHKATLHSNVEMVKFLLEHGADPNCIDHEHKYSPLLQSFSRSLPGREDFDNQCIELLFQYSAEPQYVIRRESGKIVTIFNIALNAGAIDRLKLGVAQIAVNERLGTPIHKIIHAQIDSHDFSSKYFNRCRKILNETIADSVTVFKLLSANKIKMAKYLSNERVALKLKRLKYRQKARSSFSYYWNILMNSWSKGMEYKKLKNQATEVIGKIYRNRLDVTDLIIERTIDYLDNSDLQRLCQI